jgi:hypothetical protein
MSVVVVSENRVAVRVGYFVLLIFLKSLEFLKAEYKVKRYIETVLGHPIRSSTVVDCVKYGEIIQFINLVSPSTFPRLEYDTQFELNPNLKEVKKYICAANNVRYYFILF